MLYHISKYGHHHVAISHLFSAVALQSLQHVLETCLEAPYGEALFGHKEDGERTLAIIKRSKDYDALNVELKNSFNVYSFACVYVDTLKRIYTTERIYGMYILLATVCLSEVCSGSCTSSAVWWAAEASRAQRPLHIHRSNAAFFRFQKQESVSSAKEAWKQQVWGLQ